MVRKTVKNKKTQKENRKNDNTNQALKSFSKMFEEFGGAVGKIFDDPKLKQEVNKFGASAVKSAKTFGSRFKDEEVKERFRNVGAAASKFGKDISRVFKKKTK